MSSGLNKFISEESVNLHKKYLEDLKLKYSILEKSIPEIKDMDMRSLQNARIKHYKKEVMELKYNIMCHDLYFSSFGQEYQSSEVVKKLYRSEASFLYELYNMAKCCKNGGFLLICVEKGKIYTHIGHNMFDAYIRQTPVLAIDLCEHTYFLDYEFNKDLYIERALKYINLNKIDKFL